MKFSVAAAQCTLAMNEIGRAGKVHRHRDAVLLRVVADLLGFEDAAGGGEVGMDDVDRALSMSLMKSSFR